MTKRMEDIMAKSPKGWCSVCKRYYFQFNTTCHPKATTIFPATQEQAQEWQEYFK